MSGLEKLVNRVVEIVTVDGRILVGTLRAFDQAINLVLQNCTERVFSPEKGVEFKRVGVYLLRGDCVVVVGEVDQQVDAALDYPNIRALPITKLNR